jgi:hypothetical protein
MNDPNNAEQFVQYIYNYNIDYLDFGCSFGGSLEFGRKILNGTCGLGIDISSNKVAQAKASGFNAIVFDIREIPDKRLVDFTILSHFLEHVPDLSLVKQFVRKACNVSKNFFLIKQPYFDSDGLLFRHGLKTFYSDWKGHPNMMSSVAIYEILRDIKESGDIHEFSIYAKKPITCSDDPRIHPLSSPVDQHEYNPSVHPPKPIDIEFEFPLFYEIYALAFTSDFKDEKLISRLRIDEKLYP